MRDELVAPEVLLVPARELRTCHRDLWSDNLRATAQGGLSVIDWDNCGLSDPGQELAGVLFEFGYEGATGHGRSTVSTGATVAQAGSSGVATSR